MIKIQQLKKADKKAVSDFIRLLSQLRENRAEHKGSLSDLQAIIKNKNAALIVAKDGARIIGMGTVYAYRKLGKTSGTVEDVVVDSAYRGQGLGKKIMEKIIATARAKKVNTLILTSRQERVAANRLYQKLGFKLKKTNVYSMKFPKR